MLPPPHQPPRSSPHPSRPAFPFPSPSPPPRPPSLIAPPSSPHFRRVHPLVKFVAMSLRHNTVLGIEPGTSRTRSENHSTRPSSLLERMGILNDVDKPVFEYQHADSCTDKQSNRVEHPKTHHEHAHIHTMIIAYSRLCLCFVSLVCSHKLLACC